MTHPRIHTVSLALLALAALLASCTPAEPRVEVALITDALPGVEFHFVELDLFVRGEPTPELERSARMQVATGESFRVARTITRFLPVTAGSYHLEARLLARDGVRPVLHRNLDIDVREDMRVVVRLDRACIAVECPGSGDSQATECAGGRCEDPSCTSSPLSCPTRTGCTSASDCPRNSTCSTAECLDGVCFAFPSAEACPSTSYCDATRGCVPYDGSETCGMPCALGECGVGRWRCDPEGTMTCEPFLTRPAGEPCGAGVCDNTGTCAPCVEGAPCDTGNGCEVGVTSCTTGRQVCVSAGPRPSGTTCRAAAGVCDAPESCDGTSIVCPSDARRSAGAECRASEGDCDPAEVCDGIEAACPSNALRSSDFVCRAEAGDCDAAERCDGTTALCPADARASAGTVCRASTGDCDRIESCDGVSTACPVDALQSAGAVCRAAASSCDVQEVCSGTSSACPLDAFVPLGNACAGGFCNGVGMCLDTCTPGAACSTGNPCEIGRTDCSTMVPRCVPMGPGNAGATCRAAAGPCDVADVCSGTSTTCPDLRAPVTLVCRPATMGGCDLAERCNGTAVTCPSDAFAPATSICRAAAAGGCDVAETCTGTSAACPANGFAAPSVVCRMSTDVCDVAETCSGSAATCPANAFQPATLACRPSAGVCDIAESCTGSAAACPADAFRGRATTCRTSTEFCNPAEVCSGLAASCPPDAVLPPGTVCVGGVCNMTGMCVAPPPVSGCPLTWSAGFSTQVGLEAPALSDRHLYLFGGSATAWNWSGGPAAARQGVFVSADAGAYISTVATTSSVSTAVGPDDRFFGGMGIGYGEFDPLTGNVLNGGIYTPGAGNGGVDWLPRAGAPWVYGIMAFAPTQTLAGVNYVGTDSDVLLAVISPTTGTPIVARRLVLPGTQLIRRAVALPDNTILVLANNGTAGVLDGVPVPAGDLVLRFSEMLTLLSARATPLGVVGASPSTDLVVFASSGQVSAQRADGTTLWTQPTSPLQAIHVRVLSDRILYVATLTDTRSAFGQTWGSAGMRTLMVAELDLAGNYRSGRQIPYSSTASSVYNVNAVVSPSGGRIVVVGAASRAVVSVCGTTLVNGTQDGSFVFAF